MHSSYPVNPTAVIGNNAIHVPTPTIVIAPVMITDVLQTVLCALKQTVVQIFHFVSSFFWPPPSNCVMVHDYIPADVIMDTSEQLNLNGIIRNDNTQEVHAGNMHDVDNSCMDEADTSIDPSTKVTLSFPDTQHVPSPRLMHPTAYRNDNNGNGINMMRNKNVKRNSDDRDNAIMMVNPVMSERKRTEHVPHRNRMEGQQRNDEWRHDIRCDIYGAVDVSKREESDESDENDRNLQCAMEDNALWTYYKGEEGRRHGANVRVDLAGHTMVLRGPTLYDEDKKECSNVVDNAVSGNRNIDDKVSGTRIGKKGKKKNSKGKSKCSGKVKKKTTDKEGRKNGVVKAAVKIRKRFWHRYIWEGSVNDSDDAMMLSRGEVWVKRWGAMEWSGIACGSIYKVDGARRASWIRDVVVAVKDGKTVRPFRKWCQQS